MKKIKSTPDIKKRIKIFTSFEDAEALELDEKSKISSIQRLADTTALIKKIYNYKPQKYYRIYFDQV